MIRLVNMRPTMSQRGQSGQWLFGTDSGQFSSASCFWRSTRAPGETAAIPVAWSVSLAAGSGSRPPNGHLDPGRRRAALGWNAGAWAEAFVGIPSAVGILVGVAIGAAFAVEARRRIAAAADRIPQAAVLTSAFEGAPALDRAA